MENGFAPYVSHPREPRSWTDQTTTCPNIFFLFHQRWLVEVPWEGKTSRGVWISVQGGIRGLFQGFLELFKISLSPILFLSIHTHLELVLLAQSSLSMYYPRVRVSLTSVKLAFSTSEAPKSKFWNSEIGQNLVEPQFISQHPYISGTCSFGSKLFIHALSDGLSFTDLRRTCLFYLGGVKVKVGEFGIWSKKK